MMRYLFFALLLVAVAGAFIGMFTSGYFIGKAAMQDTYVDPITVEEARVILSKAASSHQYYIDYPESNGYSIEFHEGCVKRYNQVWDLIQRLDDD